MPLTTFKCQGKYQVTCVSFILGQLNRVFKCQMFRVVSLTENNANVNCERGMHTYTCLRGLCRASNLSLYRAQVETWQMLLLTSRHTRNLLGLYIPVSTKL